MFLCFNPLARHPSPIPPSPFNLPSPLPPPPSPALLPSYVPRWSVLKKMYKTYIGTTSAAAVAAVPPRPRLVAVEAATPSSK